MNKNLGNLKHGMRNTITYASWADMKRRCNNKNTKQYEDYGGRGITYDPKWESFEEFYKDMGERRDNYTLERIDVDKGYSKENCKWVLKEDQSRNQRQRRDNTSGVKGVYRDNRIGKERWVATWSNAECKQLSKGYSCRYYGEENAFKLACEKREKEIKNLESLGIIYGIHHHIRKEGEDANDCG